MWSFEEFIDDGYPRRTGEAQPSMQDDPELHEEIGQSQSTTVIRQECDAKPR